MATNQTATDAVRQLFKTDNCYLLAALGLALESCAGQFSRLSITSFALSITWEESLFVGAGGILLGFVIFALANRRRGSFVFASTILPTATGIGFSLGLCLCFANYLFKIQVEMLPQIGYVVTTLVGLLYLFIWYERVIAFGLKGALIVVGLSLVARGALQVLILSLHDVPGICLLVAMPIMSLPCMNAVLVKTREFGVSNPREAKGGGSNAFSSRHIRRRRTAMMSLFVIVALLCLVGVQLTGSDLFDGRPLPYHLLTIAVNILAGAIIVVYAHSTLDAYSLFLFILSTVAISLCSFFLSVSSTTESGMAYILFSQLSTRLFDCLAVFFAFVFSESGRSQFHLYVLTRTISKTATTVGSAIVGSNSAFLINGTSAMQSGALIGLLVALIVLFTSIQPRQKASIVPEADSRAAPPPPIRQPFKEALESLSRQGRLTATEKNVLGFVSRGKNAETTSQELGVSINTVKTHIRNIYAKLGVHSQQELIILIGDAMEIEKKSQLKGDVEELSHPH